MRPCDCEHNRHGSGGVPLPGSPVSPGDPPGPSLLWPARIRGNRGRLQAPGADSCAVFAVCPALGSPRGGAERPVRDSRVAPRSPPGAPARVRQGGCRRAPLLSAPPYPSSLQACGREEAALLLDALPALLEALDGWVGAGEARRGAGAREGSTAIPADPSRPAALGRLGASEWPLLEAAATAVARLLTTQARLAYACLQVRGGAGEWALPAEANEHSFLRRVAAHRC